MHWLYLLFSLGALLMAMQATSTGWVVVCLLVSLALLVAWVMGWYSARIGERQRDESQMIDPSELRRLRELAEARKQAAQTPPVEPPAP